MIALSECYLNLTILFSDNVLPNKVFCYKASQIYSDETGRLILETDVMTLHHMYYVIILIVICSLCQQHVFGALIISIKNQFR